MKKCLYLVVNLRKVHLDEEDLPHKNMHDDEKTQSVEGSAELGVGGWKLEGRRRNGKILTWLGGGEMKSSLKD